MSCPGPSSPSASYRTGGHEIKGRRYQVSCDKLIGSGQPVPVALLGKNDRKAACRLLSNPAVTMDHVLESHLAATRDRCRGHDVALAIQNTGTLDFTGLEDIAERDRRRGSVGIPAHATLVVS